MNPKSLFALFFTFTASDADAVVLSPGFGDDMVIQRSCKAPLWGWADPGEKIVVNGSWGETGETITPANGRWTAHLQTPAAGGPHTIEIMGTNKISVTNVLSGDVWVCSGQSNMEWRMRSTDKAEEAISQAHFPDIRYFGVNIQAGPEKFDRVQGRWNVCTPLTVADMTAVGYFFGRTLHIDQNIPIGLLSASWGGTRIEPWTPPQGFHSNPELTDLSEELFRMDSTTDLGHQAFSEYLVALKVWIPEAENRLGARVALPPAPQIPDWRYKDQRRHQNSTFIYNGMIAPLLPFAIKGTIWYQGEANGHEDRSLYRAKMRALIQGWRQVWNQGDFPFYFVQLANFQHSNPEHAAGGDGWAQVRQAQLDTLHVENTGMAVAIDVGNANDIHPRNKKDVGERLARWALARDYGKSILPSGPLFRKMTVEQQQAILSFDYVGSGLMVGRKTGVEPPEEDSNGTLTWFAICGEDRVWHWGEAVIDGDTVIVSSPKVPDPVAIRYAFAMNPAGCNLYNREGLPASPFTTE